MWQQLGGLHHHGTDCELDNAMKGQQLTHNVGAASDSSRESWPQTFKASWSAGSITVLLAQLLGQETSHDHLSCPACHPFP